MALLFRWLMRLTTGAILVIVLGLSLAYYFAARSLPDYDRTITTTGISERVDIVRDNANVPHIFGDTETDIYFALGYAHAQDRMWQMTMLRRAAQGRMSEIFGARTLADDTLVRRLDLYNAAVASVEAQSPETAAALEAYADGVNRRLATVAEGALGRGAPEMWVFNHPIAPWEPADSIAILKLFALQQSSHIQAEVLRARTALMVGPERVADILPDVPGTSIAALPDYAALVPNVPRYTADAGLRHDLLSPVRPAPFAGASNAWAAGPGRSTSGGTLLANDPHVMLTAPTIWYLARLDLDTGGVIGGTIPGVPAILAGRSDRVGWGIAASFVDDQDLFIEEVNPANPDEYRGTDGWSRFRSRDSIVNVRDGAAVTLKLRWTDNGPVLDGAQYNVGTVTPPGHVVSLGWTALSTRDTTMTAAIELMHARDMDDALTATDAFIAPALNLTLADRTRIGMKVIGAIPRRDANHQSQGRLPSFGYRVENRWKGTFPADDNPSFLDPPGGIIGNTNNKTVDAPFPEHLSFSWGDTQRIFRWRRLMQSREVHTRESFIEAQLDTVSFTARALLPLIGADLWFTGEPAPDGTPERRRQTALDLLGAWNGEMNEHLPEPLIYAAWVRALQQRLTQDDLGPLQRQFTHADPIFIERVFRDIDGASAWCDVAQSAPVETCTDISRQALDDALIWIDENQGTTIASLRWGDAHQAAHDHPTLGRVPLLNWFVNIRQSTSGGDHTLQRGLTAGTGPAPFRNVHAAGYRGVYDFADPDSSVFISATGQSGHPLSRYYDSMGEMWRRGEYVPMSLDPALARAAAVGVTTLVPE